MQVGGNPSGGVWKHSRKLKQKNSIQAETFLKKKKKFTTSSKTVSAVPVVQTDEAVE